MSRDSYVNSSRKRKLSYDEDEFITLTHYESPEQKKSRPSIKKRYSLQHETDWNRCMEGFSDFSANDARKKTCDGRRNNSRGVKKQLLSSSKVWPQSRIPKVPPQKEPPSSLEICDWSSSSDDEPSRIPNPTPGPSGSVQSSRQFAGNVSKEEEHKKCNGTRECLKQQQVEEEDDEDYSIQCSTMSSEAPSQRNPTSCRPGQLGLEEEEEEDILTYVSEEEDFYEEVEKTPERLSSNSHSPDVSISCSDPPQLQSKDDDGGDVNPSTSCIKGSDWLKKLSEVTPEKCSTDDVTNDQRDSTKKKKKKYVKFGYVEHLQRLQAREKSSFTFWCHKNQAQQDASSRALTVEIQSCQNSYSIVSTEAVEMKESEDKNEPSSLQVLFTKTRAQQLQLEPGCVVRIQPPWQTLDLPHSNGKVVLCTNYSTVLSRKDKPVAELVSPPLKRCLLYSWTCYCQQDRSIAPADCPGEVVKTIPGKEHCEGEDPVRSPDQVPIQTNHGLQCVNPTQSVRSAVCDSILDSVEVQGAGTMNASVSFSATVQRVVCRRQAVSHDGNSSFSTQIPKQRPKELKWSLLLQDTYGAICEVMIPDSGQHPWVDVIKNGEGGHYAFHNLLIHHRTNREKNPSLFSLIDSLWLPEKFQHHISSQQDSTQESCPSPPAPSFCYILTAIQGSAELVASQHSIHTEPKFSSLADVMKVQESNRVSFKAKVIYFQNERGIENTFDVYVVDNTIRIGMSSVSYLHVQVQPLCGFHPFLDDSLSAKRPLVLVFRDIWLHKGKCIADTYSKISESTQVNDEKWLQLAVELPNVVENLNPGTLLSVQGTIVEVDEDSAYSWPACDTCGNDELSYRSDALGVLYCRHCQAPVHSPVNKMRLDIFLQTPDIPSDACRIKIQLLQSTIEKLLPEEADEEGYDVQSVLNRDIGPMNCIIISTHRNKVLKKKIIQMTEVELLT